MMRQGSDDLDAFDLLQLTELLDRNVRLAAGDALRRKTHRTDGRTRVDLFVDAHPGDELGEENAAGAEPGIGDRTRLKQRRTQCCFSRDIAMSFSLLDGHPDPGAREIDAAFPH